MIKILDATEALKVSLAEKVKKHKEEPFRHEEIALKINEAIKNGETQIIFDSFPLSDQEAYYLISLGYLVSLIDFTSNYSINWGKPREPHFNGYNGKAFRPFI